MRLKGKTAVITGAAGDIGASAARRFVAEGARVFLIDRDRKRLEEVAADLGDAAATLTTDITSEDSIRSAAATIADQGTIDVLFANAGVEQDYIPVTEFSSEEFERVININLVGAFLTAKYLIARMTDGGSVIFTSSIAALMPYPAYSAYSASKAGLIGLMRSVSADVGPRSIRCNTIHPGPVRSRMLERAAKMATDDGDVEAWFAEMAKGSRLGRLVMPDDVAGLALFLASDDSKMITGQRITVDGGVVN